MLSFGGVTFPLAVPAQGEGLLAIAQPFVAKALAYYKACLNAYLDAAYGAAMAGKAQGPLGQRACVEVGPVDPSLQLVKVSHGTPYLAIYASDGLAESHSFQYVQNTTKYRLAYVLEPMALDEMQEIASPILSAAMMLLIRVTENQSDPNYNNGEQVWDVAGTMSVTFGKWQIVPEEYKGLTGMNFCALRAELTVVERENPDPDLGQTFDGASEGLDVPDTEGGGPDFPDLVDVDTAVPNPAG